MITALILTYNEEKHLYRCLKSIESIADQIVIIDSYSTDKTVSIARDFGAVFLQHRWVNYASQFNWGLDQLPSNTEWVLRIDADEYLTPTLAEHILSQLPNHDAHVVGVFVNRRMKFQGQLIRFGGIFPVKVIRLFRHGRGRCEDRWMDEHIKINGETVYLNGDLIDDNLNSLTWWTEKHNRYANREAVDLLNLEYEFMPQDSVAQLTSKDQAGLKRWVKEKVYVRLPGGIRAFTYFFYRYVLRLGFLDGRAGMSFHFLQGFWYRYLVDAKVAEVKRYKKDTDCSILETINEVLSIDILNSCSQNQTQ